MSTEIVTKDASRGSFYRGPFVLKAALGVLGSLVGVYFLVSFQASLNAINDRLEVIAERQLLAETTDDEISRSARARILAHHDCVVSSALVSSLEAASEDELALAALSSCAPRRDSMEEAIVEWSLGDKVIATELFERELATAREAGRAVIKNERLFRSAKR